MKKIVRWIKENVLYIAWLQAFAAMAGSLFFSEILKFPPCVLCWYQRIAIYPLVLILPVGIIKKDKNIGAYALPMTIIGWFMALFQNLLYYKIIPEQLAPCEPGVSCTTKYIEYLGFITIPFLSLCAFTIIIACLLIFNSTHKKTSP